MPLEPLPIGRNHRLLTTFRLGFRSGLFSGEAAALPLLPIEGTRLIGEAIRSGCRIDSVLFSRTGLAQHGDKLLPQLSRHAEVGVADDRLFASVMEVEHPQGVAALVQFPLPALEAIFGQGTPPALVLAAAGLQDPGNLGTLIRAADAFGATGVAVLSDTVSPFNPKSVRASAGSLFHLPVVAKLPPAELIEALSRRHIPLLVAAARSGPEEALRELSGPLCLVVGQEGSGVPRELQRAADGVVSIPMAASIESLNAGVAGSILLYEVARQRRPESGGTKDPSAGG